MTDSVYPRSDHPREDLGFLLNKTARLLRARMREQLHSQGFDDTDYVVLRGAIAHWERTGEATTAPALAKELVLPYEEVSTASTRLLRDNWFVVRASGEPEALEPSAKAMKILPVMQDSGRWVLQAATNGFSNAECEQLTLLIRRMLDNLE